MKITVHAAERFLQRVFQKTTYTCEELAYSTRLLNELFEDVIPNAYTKHFAVPGFKGYRAVCIENTIVTIIPKGENNV